MRPSSVQLAIPGKHRGFELSALWPLVIVAAAVLAYINSFQGVFLFDDMVNIVQRERIRQWWPPWPAMAGRRPIADWSLAINYAIGGLEPFGYHLVNLGVHALAGVALYGVIRRTLLLERFGDRYRASAPRLALAVALLWVVHPLQTQSVTYLVQRAESMMGAFYLLTLYTAIRAATSDRPLGWYLAATVVCALGMGSKAVIVTAPLVVPLYDWVFFASPVGEYLRRRWPLYLGLVVTWSVLWLTGLAGGVLDTSNASATVGFGCPEISPVAYAMTQPAVLSRYLLLSCWPRALCLDYRWPVADSFAVIGPQAAMVLAALLMSFWLLIRRRPLGFLGAWFFLILAPTSSIVPIKDVLFEHRMYLPLAAVLTLVVFGVHQGTHFAIDRLGLGRSIRTSANGLMAASAIVCLMVVTWNRNRDYRSQEVMWRDVVAKRPDNPRAHEHIGTILIAQHRFDEGMAAYREAIHAEPTFVSAYANLANALHQTGQLPAAVEQYREAVRLDPQQIVAWMNMGDALEQQGLIEEALAAYRSAARSNPRKQDAKDLPRALFNYGTALARQARFEEAIVELREAVRLRPDYEKAHFALGLVALSLGQFEEAVVHLEKTLRLNPDHPAAPRRLAEARADLVREPAAP